MSFSLDIKNFVEKCGKNADLVVKKTVIDMFSSIVKKSPVGNPELWASLGASYRLYSIRGNKLLKTPKVQFRNQPPPGYVGGHFRANWQLNINAIPINEVDGIDKSGTRTISKAVSNIPAKAAGNVYYIANNLPYAQRLEEGWSTQAPFGMVGLTILEFQNYIESALAGLR